MVKERDNADKYRYSLEQIEKLGVSGIIEEAILKREAKRERKKKSKEVREGDWKCPMCGANVFASKNKCFKCGASRVW